MESTINEHTHSISYSDSFSRFYLRENYSIFNIPFNPSMIRLQSNNPDLQFSNKFSFSRYSFFFSKFLF